MISHSDFVAALIQLFPELGAEVYAENGLLDLEMAVFARFTQAGIEKGDRASIKRYFSFADDLVRNGDDSVKNAVCVSFLECLNLTDGKVQRSWAIGMMPSALTISLSELNRYLDELHKK